MKKYLPAMLFFFITSVAVAGPDPAYCGMVAAMAKSITADRDRGVAYKAELGCSRGQPKARRTWPTSTK